MASSQKVASPIRSKARTKWGWPGLATAALNTANVWSKAPALLQLPLPCTTLWLAHATCMWCDSLLSFRHVAESAGPLEFHPQHPPWIFERTAGARSLHHHKATEALLVNRPTHCKTYTTCNTRRQNTLHNLSWPFAQRHPGKNPSADTSASKYWTGWQQLQTNRIRHVA